MALAFGNDTDFAVDGVGEGLTDGEAETGALHEIVDLVEAVEDLGLSLGRNTGSGILAIAIQALAMLAVDGTDLLAVAQLDMSLMGVFYGIGNEIGKHLRHAFHVDLDGKPVVRIVGGATTRRVH